MKMNIIPVGRLVRGWKTRLLMTRVAWVGDLPGAAPRRMGWKVSRKCHSLKVDPCGTPEGRKAFKTHFETKGTGRCKIPRNRKTKRIRRKNHPATPSGYNSTRKSSFITKELYGKPSFIAPPLPNIFIFMTLVLYFYPDDLDKTLSNLRFITLLFSGRGFLRSAVKALLELIINDTCWF